MKIVDCFWEQRNLNSKVAEITIESQDSFCDFESLSLSDNDYVVVKVPVNRPDFLFGLSKLKFVMIELQMDMVLKMNNFNIEDQFLAPILPDIDFLHVDSSKELNELENKIVPGMFSTDRICLDPIYGHKIGCKRYVNWISDEYHRRSSELLWLLYQSNKVGYIMYKDDKGTSMRGLLGGLFKEYQDLGLGALTPCALPLYVKKEKITVKRIKANISSNNQPVWDLYQHFGYKATNPHYVYIKHI